MSFCVSTDRRPTPTSPKSVHASRRCALPKSNARAVGVSRRRIQSWSWAVMRWYARCSFCADVADATRSDAELPQFVRAIALLCSVVLGWQCRSLNMLSSHRSRSCIHCSSLPHDSFSSAHVLLMTVDQIVDRGHLELVQGAGHHARAVRAADSRGRRHAKRRSRRNRRRWRSTIWAPDWPRCLSRSLSASGSG